ncbi:MAG: Nitrogen permease regulator 2 [Trichoglossum hirsutum]|nr:MAG: Nitrogen permease regulator 2 [Trichoglossum hirsutum]
MDIIPHINGLNATSRLSALSSADPSLVKKSLSHLLYYNCLLMLDIFQYSAIYAVTAEISLLVADADVQRECAAYVAASDNCDQDDDDDDGAPPVDPALIISLYASLRQGLTLKAWCVEHEPFLAAVDVRRFISFGVIKGFLYRVHKYAVRSLDAPKPAAAAAAAAAAAMDVSTPVVVVPTGKPPARPSVVVVPGGGGAAAGDDEKRKTVEQLPLMAKYLDGTHCLDEICTDLGLSEKEVLKKLGAYGDVHIIHK